MSANAFSPTTLRGTRLLLARVAWGVLVGLALILLVALVPVNFRSVTLDWQVNESYPALASVVYQRAYALYVLWLRYTVLAVFLGVAALIAWRKSDDWMALSISLALVVLPALFGLGGYSETWAPYPTSWWMVLDFAGTLLLYVGLLLGLIALFFVFPDGRFVPRWMGWVAALSGIILVSASFLDEVWTVWILTLLATLLFATFGQFYRYQRVSNLVQRQQTKWVVLALAALPAYMLFNGVSSSLVSWPYRAMLRLVELHVELVVLLVIPLSIGISILRYRLWDIDVLIRRTLLYSVLSGLLALAYFGSVVVLQAAFTAASPFGDAQGSGQWSEPVTVLSTLAIAGLFFPLRNRVRAFIDRRFYRQKYDAAKTLADFAATARDETDIETLTARLVDVVEETLQPESVSLWLKTPTPRTPGGERPPEKSSPPAILLLPVDRPDAAVDQ